MITLTLTTSQKITLSVLLEREIEEQKESLKRHRRGSRMFAIYAEDIAELEELNHLLGY